MFGGLLQHEKKPGSISISNESHDKNENLLRGTFIRGTGAPRPQY